ncbi:hypothetical protein [Streptomyces sp. NPDC014995]
MTTTPPPADRPSRLALLVRLAAGALSGAAHAFVAWLLKDK